MLLEFMVQLYFVVAFFASLLFRLAALFLWMMPRLASLSIMLTTSGNLSEASFPDATLRSRNGITGGFAIKLVSFTAFCSLPDIFFCCTMISHISIILPRIYDFSRDGKGKGR